MPRSISQCLEAAYRVDRTALNSTIKALEWENETKRVRQNEWDSGYPKKGQ